MKAIRCISFLALLSTAMFAQSDRGTIIGTVTDPGGAVVPGVRITATQFSTNVQYKATTTLSGEFVMPSLPVGDYKVVIESQGFKSAVHSKANVTGGGTVRLDTTLEVGTVQQSIEVSAQSNMLDADDAKLHNDVNDTLIQGLPTVVDGRMRSPFDLAALTAGANGTGGSFQIGGGQAGAWGVLLDGVSANTNNAGNTTWAAINTPSLEAIEQFSVVTNGFKAEYGRAGGGTVTFVSKSGTNAIHGTAFDYIRNNFFDARGFFAKSVSTYRQHDFGATLGGPVRIPKVYNGKDKTFFFFAYEGFRNRVGVTTAATSVPPLEFYDGDFRNLVTNKQLADGSFQRQTIYDPNTNVFDSATSTWKRSPFPNNQIPKDRFDPISANIMALAKQTMSVNLRKDVVPGTWAYWQQNYWQSGSTINPNDKYSIKLDHDLTPAHRLSFYYGFGKSYQEFGADGPPGRPGILNGTMLATNQSPTYRASWDYTISAHLHNRFYFGANIFKNSNLPIAWQQGWKSKGICIPNVSDCDTNLPIVGTGEFGSWGGESWNGSGNPTYSFNDNLDWIKGKHSFKAGYQYEWTPYQAIGLQNVSGNIGFSSAHTNNPQDSSGNTGLQFASFMLGAVNTSSVTSPRFFNMMWNYNAWFFQDDWRVNPRLTLNLGVRYEFNFPTTLQGNKCSDFNPTMPNPGASGRLGALSFCGNGTSPMYMNASGPRGWYKGVAPRASFAWNPKGTMVVRGGVGRSFGPLKTLSGSAHFQGWAWVGSPAGGNDQSGGITPAFQMSKGLPPWTVPPFIDPTFANNTSVYYWNGQEANRLPEYYNWNLSIQREISNGFLVEAGYAAMVGAHLLSNELDFNRIDINKLPASLSIFTAAGRSMLNRNFNDPALKAAGFTPPYSEFPSASSLAQALRPYPQYTAINTGIGGDHSGHSNYQSMLLKVTRRYAHGLVLDASYVLSKMLTDSEGSANNNATALDAYNLRLDKRLSGNDRTHEIKINWVYELPLGPRKRWLHKGLLAQAIGGWRLGTTHRYASGVPLAFGGAFAFPGSTLGNRPTITQYDDWRAPTAGDTFDPNKDRYFKLPTLATWAGDTPTITQQGWFPLQPRDRVGNMTANNPKMRDFPQYSENVSLSKTFSVLRDNRMELDARLEAFNVLNRVTFGTPNTNMSDPNYGFVSSQANSPRKVQLALKLMW